MRSRFDTMRAERLTEILASRVDPHIGGGIAEAGKADRRVDQETLRRVAGVLCVALQQAAADGDRLAQIRRRVGDRLFHWIRGNELIKIDRRVDEAFSEEGVETGSEPVERLQRIVVSLVFFFIGDGGACRESDRHCDRSDQHSAPMKMYHFGPPFTHDSQSSRRPQR